MTTMPTLLQEATVVRFDGFRPDPEASAHAAMQSWLSDHPEVPSPRRVLGHNIDREGRPAHDVDNEGYRLELIVPPDLAAAVDDATVGTLEGGRFAAMTIEGSFDADPRGSWIAEGWQRLHVELSSHGLHPHPSGRWYEEWLPPSEPGTVRFCLLAEIM